MRRIATLPMLAATTLLPALGGCNTVKGFGTDVHDIAQNVQNLIESDRYATDARTPSPSSPSRSINSRQASAY